MNGRIISLVGRDFEPKRFVSVVVATIPEHCTFEIDDAPAGLDAAKGYLNVIRKRTTDRQIITKSIAQTLIRLAGQDDPDPSLSYLNAFALTELMKSPYIVIEIRGGKDPMDVRRINARDIVDARGGIDDLSRRTSRSSK